MMNSPHSPQSIRTLQERATALAALRELERRKRNRERAETLKTSFRDFVRASWSVVEPAKPYLHGWHVDAISEHLQAVRDHQIQFLLINIPPGHAKSLLVAVQFPAWLWCSEPQYRLICGTYSQQLTIRDAVRSRDLLNSPWYQETFQPAWKLKEDSNAKDEYYNTRSGFRLSVSVTGRGTGLRGNGIVLDDVLSVQQARSDAERTRACEWVTQTMSSRRNDLAVDWQIAIGQRLHEKDPYGEMLESGKYTHLCLPSEYEPERRCKTVIGWEDPRSKAGDLLFPALFPANVIQAVKKDLGSWAYNGQHQQRPAPGEGGVFKRHWWRYWHLPGQPLPPVTARLADGSLAHIDSVPLPTEWETQGQSWDCAFKDLSTSDFVVGTVWGAIGADRYLLDLDKSRRDFPSTVQAVRNLTAKWPNAHEKLVEDKANGPAVVSTLRHEIAGLIEVSPEGGKVARAAAVSPQVEAGNVYLPHPLLYDWVGEFLEEISSFPLAAHDDCVDSLTQILLRWSSGVRMGVVEYLKETQGHIRKIQESRFLKPETSEHTESCPSCESTAIAKFGTSNRRCNQCGHSWVLPAKVDDLQKWL